MNFYCVKCSVFTKNRNIKVKSKIDCVINLYSRCIDCGFKMFGTIDEEDLSYLLKGLM